MWDGQFPRIIPPAFKDVQAEVMTRLTRLIAAIPTDVELGIHLCYGDLDAKHFVEPRDAAKLTEVANAISAAAQRRIAYIHMPVPIARDDEDFFRPLSGLRLKAETELYLGLVHSDGVANTKRRIAAAHKYVAAFGIGTECGIGRKRRPDAVRSLFKIHAESSVASPR